MERRDPTQKALVLAGGGARGSYQVGVWRALMELDWHPQIITGTSVGGLNGAMFVLDRYETARDMWLTIRSRDVMELPEENADLSALHQFLRRVVKEGGMDVTPLEAAAEDAGVDPTRFYTTRTLAKAFLAACDKDRMESFAPLFTGSSTAGQAALAALLPNTFLQALVWRTLTASALPEVTEDEGL